MALGMVAADKSPSCQPSCLDVSDLDCRARARVRIKIRSGWHLQIVPDVIRWKGLINFLGQFVFLCKGTSGVLFFIEPL